MAKFKKGQSGNRKGRPRGIKDKRVQFRDVLQSQAPQLVQTAIARALKGDSAALRLCLERIMPPLRARDEAVTLPALTGTLTEQGSAILTAMAAGQITPQQAGELLGAIASQARLREADEIEERLRALEARFTQLNGGRS